MNRTSLVIAVLIFPLIACLAPGCKDDGVTVTDYVMRVDSITVPEILTVADTLRILVYTSLPSGCHSYHRTEMTLDRQHIELMLWGRRSSGICTQEFRILEREYRVDSFELGYFRIIVKQPDGTSLEDSVYIDK